MTHLLLVVIYIAFISLGLPDSMLGSAWPSMYEALDVPVSYAGIISMIIVVGTVIASLQSARLNRRLGTGLVTALSVELTAVALLGFSWSHAFWQLCLLAIPYGLGAGSVDAALNNYVAMHYASHHMSWLHCMWGTGTIIGPYVISHALLEGHTWHLGYRWIGLLQVALALLLLCNLLLWRRQKTAQRTDDAEQTMTLREIFAVPGARSILVTFFCYCAVEQTTMLWASSYMVLHNHISAEAAAGYASMFFIGITVGRALNGFLTMKRTDTQMVRIGQGMILLGIAAMLLPLPNAVTIVGLVLVGLGCAPIYPCIIHTTPERFGAQRSQAMIGAQMAFAYVGICLMPPLFGWIANFSSTSLLSVYLLVILAVMTIMHEMSLRRTRAAL